MRTKIICELASSWNGDLDLMKALIKTSAENGGDLCKLQDYRADRVPSTDPDKARYEKYEMKDEYYPQFLAWCSEYNIEPLVTCFNADRVRFLSSLGLQRVKIASISMTNKELLLEAGANFEELIVSTAFYSKEEIEETIDWLATNAQKFTMMVCTGNYPLSPKDANLNRIDEMKKMIDGIEQASVGYSDHSLKMSVAYVAASKGITYLEKHFSLSRYLPQIPHQMYEGGPMITTHQVSIEPKELLDLAYWCAQADAINGGREFKTNEMEKAIKNKYINRYGK